MGFHWIEQVKEGQHVPDHISNWVQLNYAATIHHIPMEFERANLQKVTVFPTESKSLFYVLQDP